MLTTKQIENGKMNAPTPHERHHEHDDCIRMAYEWLDAQKRTKQPTSKPFALKHIIENWGGRYVSQSDVEVAAWLHPDIKGTYPYFNISARLTLPSESRLEGIGEAYKHNSSPKRIDQSIYKFTE
ncbi:hypothetical protein [Roseovarius sp.]|uniref:hypothetical protein n=1 Tax=Roseovarius sp. TaxID=1486281 RepID=UPI003A9716B2